MREIVLSFLSIARSILDCIVGLYFLYLIYLAFVGGNAWITNIHFEGSVLSGFLWLFIISPICIAIFDFLMNLILISVVAPVILLFDRSNRLQEAATSEIISVNNNDTPLYIGFGGWLYLYAIGLIIAFISSFFYLVDSLFPLMNNNDLNRLINMNINWAIIVLVEFIFHSGMIIFITLIGYYCLKQRTAFVKTSIAFMIFIVAGSITMYFICLLVPETAENSGEALKTILRSIVYSIIWMPYMLKSRRVKNTFIF